MGRIKSMLIKRTAKTLVKTNENCTNDFEQNKKVLEQYNMPDKGTRNKIAGYIGRIKKADISEIFIGNKPLMRYVIAAMLQIKKENSAKIKGRGKFISKAVDAAEV